MLRSHRIVFHRLFLAIDVLLIAIAAASCHIGSGWWLGGGLATPFTPSAIAGQLGVLVVIWVLVAGRLAVYRPRRSESLWLELECLLEAWVVTIGLMSMADVLAFGGVMFRLEWLLPGGLCLLWLQRLTLRQFLHHVRSSGKNFRRVLFVGRGASTGSIVETITQNPQFGLRIFGWVSFSDEEPRVLQGGVGHAARIGELQMVLTREPVDFVIVCPSAGVSTSEIESVFELCDEAGIQCQYAPHFLSLRNLQPEVTWYGEIPAFAFHPQVHPAWKYGIKRAIDIAVASVLVLIMLPVFVAIALAIKLEDRGPILFRQRRVGMGGRQFDCLKFRTMRPDAEALRAQLEASNEQDGPVFKIRNDPRITRVGRFLRRYSLDEFPQLFNVLRGDMSIVGPRPPIPDEVENYDWWQRRRVSVRPGLTCIWQVFGRNQVSFDRWMEMDLYYIDHWSLVMDLKLMVRTIGVVLRGTGM